MPNNLISLVTHLPTATLLTDLEGNIVEANLRAEKLLGKQVKGYQLDNIIDFSNTDLPNCSSFDDAARIIKARNFELNIIGVKYKSPPVNYLNLFLSFFCHDDQHYVLVGMQDVSERVKLIEAFEYKQNILDNIVTTSSDALIVFDDFGCIELFSPAAETMFGKTSTEMIIEDIYSMFSENCREKVSNIINHLKSGGNSGEILIFEDLSPVNATGENFPASITFSRSQKDADTLFFMIISDKSLFQKFVNSVNDAYIKTDDRGQILDVNNKAEELFNYDRNILINKHISFLGIRDCQTSNVLNDISSIENKDHADDYVAPNQRGSELTLNLTVWPQAINNIRLNNLIIRDISQKKIAEKQLITTAFTDTLTNLANRASFNNKLAEQIKSADLTSKSFALVAIDLDKFKAVNDSFGHDYGDELLKASASRLSACVRDHDLVSRMGGDEFTVIIREIESQNSLTKIADRILRTFRRDFTLKDKRINISSSIGVAVYPDDAKNAEELYRAADMAMYAAKRSGKDSFRIFSKELYLEYEREKTIERSLISAISNNELSLHYQPKISFSTQRVVGFEALLRWYNPQLGHVSPVEFIPIAEESGCIIELTKWVLTSAIRSMKRWASEYADFTDRRLTIAINISADHFKQNLFEDINRILTDEKFDPNLLEIEITEGVLLEHTSDVVDILKNLRDLGVHISMDDFGTGYSSLQYLKHFTLNTIKIDRSFVRDIHEDQHNMLIIESIVSITKRLHLNLVAEGVEQASEIQYLVSLGCDVFQGYYFSKPLPEDNVGDYLADSEATIQLMLNTDFK